MTSMFTNFFILHESQSNSYYNFPKCDTTLIVEKPFIFPCNDFQSYECGIFIVVFTDINGDKTYVINKYIDSEKIMLCIKSAKPWWELYFNIMGNVVYHKLYKSVDKLDKYFGEVSQIPAPMEGVVIYIPPVEFSGEARKVTIPNRISLRPFMHFLRELHTRLKIDEWIVIFESILLEKWIVFHSCYLDRVTNCLFGALSLIFPMEWVHLVFPCLSTASLDCLGCPTPFIAGIHSCMLENSLRLLNPGTLVVDVDRGQVYTVSPDCPSNDAGQSVEEALQEALPRPLTNILYRSHAEFVLRLEQANRSGPRDANHMPAVQKCYLNLARSFLDVVAVLIGHYREFGCYDEKKKRFVVAKEGLIHCRPQLDTFVARLLESQLVHQFLDQRLNSQSAGPVGRDASELKISLHEPDHFAVACAAMYRWQPDPYVERLSHWTTVGRQKMTVITDRMQKTVQRRNYQLESKTIFYPTNTSALPSISTPWTQPHTPSSSSANQRPTSVSDSNDDSTPTSGSSSVIPVTPDRPLDTVARPNWVTFEDSMRLEKASLWSPTKEQDAFNDQVPRNEPRDNKTTEEDLIGDLMAAPTALNVTCLPSVIQDFDPLFQN